MKAKLVSLFALALGAPAAAHAGTITVTITGIKKAVGDVYASLCDRKQWDARDCPTRASTPAKIEGVTIEFDNVPAGRYLVAIYQDVNKNGKLDYNLVGMPSEPVGISGRKPLIPNFKDAAFDVGAQPLAIKIKF